MDSQAIDFKVFANSVLERDTWMTQVKHLPSARVTIPGSWAPSASDSPPAGVLSLSISNK